MDDNESARLAHVLEKALTVFTRYGFRKTSIEDIAKAAGISRQGIYFHFKNKDEIFKASIQKSLDDRLRAANKIFDDDRLTLEEKWIDLAIKPLLAARILREDARRNPLVLSRPMRFIEEVPLNFTIWTRRRTVSKSVSRGAVKVLA